MSADERKKLVELVHSETERRYDDSRAVLDLSAKLTTANSAINSGQSEEVLLAEAFAELNTAEISAGEQSAEISRAAAHLLPSGSVLQAAAGATPAFQPLVSSDRLEQLLSAAAGYSSSSRCADRLGDDESGRLGSGDVTEGGGLTLSMLTPAERKLFLRAVASGELASVLPIDEWRPWWQTQQHSLQPLESVGLRIRPQHGRLDEGLPADGSIAAGPGADGGAGTAPVADANAADDADTDAEGSEGDEPPICVAHLTSPLPPLVDLLKTRPPAGILFCNAVSVLTAYAHVQRLYAGDWSGESALELARLLLSLTGVLAADARFESPAQACDAFIAAANHPEVSWATTRRSGAPPGAERETDSFSLGPSRSLTLLPLTDAWSIFHGGRPWISTSTLMTAAGADSGVDGIDAHLRLPDSHASSAAESSRKVLILEAVDPPRAVASASGATMSGGSPASTVGGGRSSSTPSPHSRFVSPGRHYAVDALLHCRSVFEGALAEAQAGSHPVHAAASSHTRADKPERSSATRRRVPLRVMPRVLRQLEAASRKLHFVCVWAWDEETGIRHEELASACAALTTELHRREADLAAASAAASHGSYLSRDHPLSSVALELGRA